MHSRTIAAVAVIVSLIGVAFVTIPFAEAAPPQPHTFFGIARDAGGTPLPFGTRITAWVDGVDYSNGTSVYVSAPNPFNYDMDVFGDNHTDFSTDNTPTIKTGGDFNDEIMFVAGDLTNYKASNPQQVFTGKDFWATGLSENLDLTLAAAGSQPGLPKIGRITTRPADGWSQYLYLCNPTPSVIDASLYFIEKPVPGSFSGPIHALTGLIPAGGRLYVNLTSWGPTENLTATGDALKLVWNNPPGGPAFQGSDIIVDRVEFNLTFSGTFIEPVNTIMTDATAPGFGQEIRRIGVDTCQDTNNNSVDFGIMPETGRPVAGNTPPTVTISTPSGSEDWTGNTIHRIFWNHSDAEDAALAVAIDVWDGFVYIPGGGNPSMPNGSNFFDLLVPCLNLSTAIVRVRVFDSGGLIAESFSNTFTIDCAAPTLLSTIPPDAAPNVSVSTDVTLQFDENMNQVATDGAISFAPGPVSFTTTWGPGTTVVVSPTLPLLGNTMYTVTVSCAARDDSDPGNALANCPRTFSFTTTIADPAPTVDLTDPDGGEVWSGGSSHTIYWNMSDDVPGALNVDLEYSVNGGSSWSPITALSRPQGANFYAWTIPCPGTTQTRVRVTATDGASQSSADMSAANFSIDCTAPTVTATIPTGGANNVDVAALFVITFSEPMDQPTVQVSFSGGVSGPSFVWTTPTTLEVSHNSLSTCAPYTGTVAATAEDLSEPGNPMAGPHVWSFTTECAPTIVILAPSALSVFTGGFSQILRFTVTDADATVFVWINWTSPVPQSISQSPRPTGVLQTFSFSVPFANTTAASITVTAQDSTSLNGAASVTFEIDSTPPTVVSSNPAHGATNVLVTATIAITFSEPMDRNSTEGAISLPGVGALTFVWTGPSSVTVSHALNFATNASYTLTVANAAEDDSDPGNTLAGPYTATFTTSSTGAVTADAGGPYTGRVGALVRLDGSASVGTSLNYTWEITHPGGATSFAYNVRPDVRFPAVGTYQILLTVRDGANNTDTDSTTAQISEAPGGTSFFTDYWWVFLILILAILGALIFVGARRRKKDEHMPPEVPPEDVEVTPSAGARESPGMPPPPPPAGATAGTRGATSTRECPMCGTILDVTDKECFMCGAKL